MEMALERAAREEACTHFPACEGTKAGPGCGNSARMEKMCCRLDQIHTYCTYMPKAVGDTELQLTKITELVFLARIHALFPHPLLSGRFTNSIFI